MLDYRVQTFLKVCDVMNYRITADKLNMTQPAVTKHIQQLEAVYGCKLFNYNGKQLTKTKECVILENSLRTLMYEELSIEKKLKLASITVINVGVTKTIADYILPSKIVKLANRDNVEVNLYVDNTSNLIEKLQNCQLDFLAVEGWFDKNKFSYTNMSTHQLVGICAKDHPFAQKEIELSQIFDQRLIVRESGSGTRHVFSNFLKGNNYTENSFNSLMEIASFKLIELAVAGGCGISFVYDVIAQSNDNLATFTIKNCSITNEFNYIYLKNSSAEKLLSYFQI